jgi:hypothetical protein
MEGRLEPSRRLAVGFVLTLGTLLGVALFGESARVALRTPLVPREARSAPVSVPLDGRDARRGAVRFRLELVTHDPAALLAHEELQLFFEAAGPRRALVAARLELRGTGCSLVAGPRRELTSREAVVFRRSPECLGLSNLTVPATTDLVVEVRGEGGLALLGFERRADGGSTLLQGAPTRLWTAGFDVRGALIGYPETAPRIVLLQHMWRGAPGVGWVASLSALALGLACAGCVVFPTLPIRPTTSRLPAIARGATGAALLAGSLALLHAVLEPPLSGPDEPYHLLGFADLVSDEALARDTVSWMGETHVWRTRQQPFERFRTIDVNRPYVVPDDQLRPTEVAMRSAVVARVWRAASPLARGVPAHRALFALRLVNVLLFAVAVAAATALAMALVAEPFAQWLVYPFLFVPSLPFFATHVSETAVLCSIYTLLAAAVAIVALDGSRAHWAGLPLGLSSGLMLAGGRGPWPLLALVGTVLAGRVALGGADATARRRSAFIFWGGFGLGLTIFFALMDEPYRLMTETTAINFAALPAALRDFGRWLLTQPLAAAVIFGGGTALELVLARPRELLAQRWAPIATPIVVRSAAVLAVAVVISLAASLLVSYPQLSTEDNYTMPLRDRVVSVLATMATMFRLTEPNFLLASSFWVGFGWLDTIPKPPFQGLLMALCGACLAWLLSHVAGRRQPRRFLWLAIVALGAGAALVVYAASTQGRISTLVGRHLIGWYLVVLTVIGSALTLEPERTAARNDGPPAGTAGGWRAALLLLVAGGAHAYCLSFILRRYF